MSTVQRLLPLLAWGGLLALPVPAAAQSCPANISYPGDAWPSDEAALLRTRPDKVAELDKYLFTRTGAPADRTGIRTNGVVVIHKGHIIFEKYAGGFGPGSPHIEWSASKSVQNALIGILVKDGRMQLSDSVCAHVPTVREDNCDVTIQHLAEWSSGLKWVESYESGLPRQSSVLSMLYGIGSDDMARFVAAHEARDTPGETFMYSSGDTNLLSRAVTNTFMSQDDEHFAWHRLFDPLGMETATWERDSAGTPIASSYFYASARDFARYGYLYLHDGCWGTERILPEGWVAQSMEISSAVKKKGIDRDPTDVPGISWWLNKDDPASGITTPWPDAPADTFAARGHWGQYLFVIPSLDLVVVRNGDDRDDTFTENDMLKRVADLVR